MTKKPFDPYRKWLGIPPHDQPPNHYRLLGIEVFESDPDVISNAADGRMGQIRTFQTGRHSDWSQRLLNEVAAARVCLLNEEKKAAYDETLRQELGSQNAPPVVSPRPGSPPVAPPEIVTPGGSGVPRPFASNSGFFGRRNLPVLIAIVSATALLVVLAAVFLRSGPAPVVKPPPDVTPGTDVALLDDDVEDDALLPPDQSPDDEDVPPTTGGTDQDMQPGPDNIVTPDTVAPEDMVTDVDGMPEAATDDVDKGTPNEPPPTTQVTVTPVPETPTPPTPTPQPPKPTVPPPNPAGLGDLMKPPSRDVPEDSAVKEAQGRIREIFEDDFGSLETPAAKVALAAKLRQQGLGTRDDQLARFAFLKTASDLAVSAADPGEAFRAIDSIGEHFDADILAMKAETLTEVVKDPRVKETGAYLAQAAAVLAEEAADRDDYETATRLFTLGGTAARKAGNKPISGELAVRVREIARTARAFTPVEKALGVLADDPLDAESTTEVGHWRCFQKNDWSGGLPYFAKDQNTTLAELAKRDLATTGNLITAEQQRQLGDGWWELSESERGDSKAAYICRAVHWYQKALPGISGLNKAAVMKRLEAAAHNKDVVKSPIWGAVEEGNVALATNGTSVRGVKTHADRLLDGNYTMRRCAGSPCPSQWVITFAKPYRLKEIRFRLWDVEPRFFRYQIGTSSDGKEFVTLADRSQGNWSSWQQFRFSSRLVKAVKIIGLYGSVDKAFVVREFEAYCIPPEKPPRR